MIKLVHRSNWNKRVKTFSWILQPKRQCVKMSSSSKRKRTNAPILDSSTDNDIIGYPFNGSDDSHIDPDFQIEKKSRNVSKRNQTLHMKPKLTRKQRIERLKQKSAKFELSKQLANVSTDPRAVSVLNESQMPSSIIFENHDHLFNDDKEEDKHGSSSCTSLSESLHIVSDDGPGVNNPVMTTLLEMQQQIVELTKTVNILRKQVTRIEIKSSKTNGDAGDDAFMQSMDFDLSLSKENLPLKSCVEVNDLELKLRHEPQYGNKLVITINKLVA